MDNEIIVELLYVIAACQLLTCFTVALCIWHLERVILKLLPTQSRQVDYGEENHRKCHQQQRKVEIAETSLPDSDR